MKINKTNKIILITIILIIFIIGIIPIKSNAVMPIDSAYIYANRKTDALLLWNGMGIHTHLAIYNKDGAEYPAYCMNRELPGVEIGFSQDVDVNNLISNVMVWRAIINGYPYKTISELGCVTEEEAYLATKQAVYCMLTNRDVNEYSAIGESGERVLNALKQIVNNARTSNEIKASSELTVKQLDSLWKIDNIDNSYISQEFEVSANASIDKYNVELSEVNVEGVKITNGNNEEQTEFKANEKFKVLMPITNILEDGSFIINVSGKVATKPVLYGKSKDPSLQSYALTGYTYEDGTGSRRVYYTQNDTKIIIIKKDEAGEKYLQGVEFNLLDSNKNVIYTGLATDENGKIEINNLLPGNYFVQETRTLEGYDLYEKLIEIKLSLNETSTVNVINTKEQVEIEVEKPDSEITVKDQKTEIVQEVKTVVEEVKPEIKEVQKLPKTGM